MGSETRTRGRFRKRRLSEPQLSLVNGAVSGLAMGLYLMTASWLHGGGFLAPMRMIGQSLDPARIPIELGFRLQLGLGLLLHMATSIFWALRYKLVVEAFRPAGRSAWLALLAGLSWGAAVWLLMGLIVGPTLNPKLRVELPLHYLLAHLLYGCSTALVYLCLARSGRSTDASPTD